MKLVRVGDYNQKVIQIVREMNDWRRGIVDRLHQKPVVHKRKILIAVKDPKKV